MKKKEFWFIVGSQHLYGPEVLETVAARAAEMAAVIDSSEFIPCRFIYKATVKTADEVTSIIKEANYDDNCLGIVTWCHTFSPSKMWINGLSLLQKPYCHFATQYNREIPNEEIDMDFMNLNQAAHGDREHGFIGARMRLPRKIIMGYWQDEPVLRELGRWMRSAVGYAESRSLKEMAAVGDGEIDELVNLYREKYTVCTDDIEAIRYQAREEIAIKHMLDREGATAFTNTFEDLYGMEQLPGLASQRLMEQGYGYGGEGDWKVAAMTRIVKAMTEGMGGGSGFMEDYTYHLLPGSEYSLGAHMLEVCPTLAADKPRIEVHPLGIGMNEKDPARLVFEGKAGKGVVASLVDLGGRLRLIVQDIEAVKPIMDMPNLPVARVMWRAMPDLCTGARMWIAAGGAHHTVLSYDATPQMLEDFAEMAGIEYVHISKDTSFEALKQQLFLSDLAWKLK